MRMVICTNCKLGLRIIEKNEAEGRFLIGEESDFRASGYNCPRCGARAAHLFEQNVDPDVLHVLELIEVTAQEAVAALHGLGFPSERQCSEETVIDILQRKKIKSVIGRTIVGRKRYCIDKIIFKDGTIMHFCASSFGAAVYRITPPRAYTEKVLDEAGESNTQVQKS